MNVYFWGDGNLTYNCLAKIDNSIAVDQIDLLTVPLSMTAKVMVLAKRRSRSETIDQYLETLSKVTLRAQAIGFERIIFLSSFAIYGPPNEYRKEKILAESFLRKLSLQNNFDLSILRLPNVIGFAKDPSIKPYTLIGQLVFSAKNSGCLFVDSIIEEFRYFIHVDRVVDEISRLSHQPSDKKILHLLEYRQIKVKHIIDLVAKIFDVPIHESLSLCHPHDKGLSYPKKMITHRERSNLKSNSQLLKLVSRLISEEASLF